MLFGDYDHLIWFCNVSIKEFKPEPLCTLYDADKFNQELSNFAFFTIKWLWW